MSRFSLSLGKNCLGQKSTLGGKKYQNPHPHKIVFTKYSPMFKVSWCRNKKDSNDGDGKRCEGNMDKVLGFSSADWIVCFMYIATCVN